MTGFKRRDVSISRTSAGGLHIDVEVTPNLSASVDRLLAALGLKPGRRSRLSPSDGLWHPPSTIRRRDRSFL